MLRYRQIITTGTAGGYDFSSSSRNVKRLSRNGSSSCLDGTPCIPNASFSKNSFSPENYIFVYHMVVTLIMADDVATQISQKAVRLLQQSDGAPRFGKHGLQLCLVQGVSESRQRARQRVFPHCAASFLLEIRKVFLRENVLPSTKIPRRWTRRRLPDAP